MTFQSDKWDYIYKKLIKYRTVVYIAIVTLLTIYNMRSFLDEGYFFFFDDWGWLHNVIFLKYSDLFNILPSNYFGDRPINSVLIKLIYDIFGLNNVAFHGFLIFVHLINTTLVFLIIKRIFNSLELSLIAALLFCSHQISFDTVGWISVLHDVFCNTLLLTSLYMYIRNDKYFKIIGLFTYILALRTKETAIFFPIFLFFYELSNIDYLHLSKHIIEQFIKNLFKKQFLYYLVMVLYGSLLLFLYINSSVRSTPIDPYYHSLTFKGFFSGLWFYLGKILYINNGVIQTMVTLIFIFLIFLSFLKKRKEIFWSSLGFIILLLPVIFLINHRYPYYSYISLIYFIIFLVALANELLEFSSKLSKKKHSRSIIIIIFILCSLLFSFKGQNNYSASTSIYKNNIEYMKNNFPKPATNTVFFISGLPNFFNVFDYCAPNHCNSLRVLYKDQSIKCAIYEPETELKKRYYDYNGPKYFLEYKEGKLYQTIPGV